MSFDDSTYDQIEAYLNGEMPLEEQNAFDERIAGDKSLAVQVEKHKLANALVIQQRLFQVKNILHEEQAKNLNPGNYKLYAITALAIIGTAAGVIVYKNTDTNKSNQTTVNSIRTESTTASSGIPANKDRDADRAFVTHDQQTASGTSLHKQEIQQYEQAMREGTYTATQPFVDTILPAKKVENKIIANEAVAKPDEVKDICAGTVIKADIKTTATCLHESSGNVVVQNIHGGTKPYSVSIENMNNEFAVNGQLSAGMYQIKIMDANACEKQYDNVPITAKECAIDYSFNPFMGEKWQIDAYASAGLLQVYNKGGMLYYQTHIDANAAFEWSGIGSSNQIQAGYYIFVIKYADGTVKKGSVTIVQ